jgi:predicted Zn-dependent peptidase
MRSRPFQDATAALQRAVNGWRHAADQPLSAGVKIPPHQRFTLPNGIKIILVPRHDVPLIGFEAVLRGGARLDPGGHAGVASLTAELLTHGAGDRDAFGFADAVEGAGGSLDVEAHSEAIVLHGQFLARDRELMVALLADAVVRPHFEAAELAKLRSRRVEFIKAAKDSEPQSLLSTYGRALMFAGHPFGRPVGGSESSLSAISREQVMTFYEEQFGADRLILVFAGDFDAVWLKRSLIRAFASWRRAPVPLAPLAAARRAPGRRVLLVDAPGSTQTYFWIANLGVARSYPHRAALEITNTAFGASFGSMLMQALRVKTGLTYSANSSFRRGSVAGEFAMTSFTQTASTVRAIDIALHTLDDLKQSGVGEAAIRTSRSYILGQYPLGFETAADWAAALADLELYGLPEGQIADFGAELMRVDEAACRQVVASAFPDSADVDLVLIGDAARIRQQVQKYGSVAEKPLEQPDFEPGAPPTL